MTNPTSIESYVDDIIADEGDWSDAMEAIKGLIEDGVPLKEEVSNDTL